MSLIGSAFSVRNSHEVNFDYYIATVDIPLSVIMVGSFAIGVLLAIFAVSFMVMKYKIQLSSTRRKLRKLESKHTEILSELNEKNIQIKHYKVEKESSSQLIEVID